MKLAYRYACPIALALTMSACATHGDAPVVAPALPAAFDTASAPAAMAPGAQWWRGFDSAELGRLIDLALADSPDLGMATERVRQAEAQATIAGASLFPALNATAGASRRGSHGGGEPATSGNSFSAGLAASYELDLWGGNAAGARAASQSLRAAGFDRQTVRLTLMTGVATAYFQSLALQERLSVARDNVALAEKVFKVVDSRHRNGAVSALDLARQQSTLLGQRAALEPLELQQRQTLRALAILCGQAPQGFAIAPADLMTLTVPQVAPGLPSDLLRRRPDLASAEAQLAAARANVAVARAALLPSISLSGSAGASSAALRDLVSAPTIAYSLGASLAQAIFDGGRLRAARDIADARERELVLVYRKAILASLADVDNALTAAERNAAQELLQIQVREQAVHSLAMAEVRYREGADDLLVLLDAQRSLFQARDQVAQARVARLQAALDLIKALGGGWQAPR